METESWVVVARGWRWGNRERLVRGHELSVIKWIRSEDLMDNLVTVVDDIVLYWYNWNLLRVELKCSHQKKVGKKDFPDGFPPQFTQTLRLLGLRTVQEHPVLVASKTSCSRCSHLRHLPVVAGVQTDREASALSQGVCSSVAGVGSILGLSTSLLFFESDQD